jgi:ribosomal protein L37AE/L43A
MVDFFKLFEFTMTEACMSNQKKSGSDPNLEKRARWAVSAYLFRMEDMYAALKHLLVKEDDRSIDCPSCGDFRALRYRDSLWKCRHDTCKYVLHIFVPPSPSALQEIFDTERKIREAEEFRNKFKTFLQKDDPEKPKEIPPNMRDSVT